MSEMRITQEELAEYVGVTVPVILQKINNVRPFPLREADKVANKLRIKDEEFGKYFFSDRKIIPVRCFRGLWVRMSPTGLIIPIAQS